MREALLILRYGDSNGWVLFNPEKALFTLNSLKALFESFELYFTSL